MNSHQIQTPFEHFDEVSRKSGPVAALKELGDYLIEQKRFHELFEVRKLQLRCRMGLPIERWQSIDELPDEQGKELEEGLLDICREVGEFCFRAGDVAAGWQYMEPVGDRTRVAQLLDEVEVTDENVEALIQVSVGSGIRPELGFQTVLDRFGTCSSITTYESQLAGQPLTVRRGPARLLVEHLYDELVGRLKEAIREQEGRDVSDSASLTELIEGRDWLFQGLGHHIDTTHLASTVRISKIVVDEEAIDKAKQLAAYGKRLHEDFQFRGHIPFENIHHDTYEFLNAVDGTDPQPAVDRLRSLVANRGESTNLDPAAWYVYLLDRLQRGREAIEAYLDWVHVQQGEGMMSEDVCPSLMALVSKYGQFDLVREKLCEQGDLLGYATVASIEQKRKRPKPLG